MKLKQMMVGVGMLCMANIASAAYIFDLRGDAGDVAEPYAVTSTDGGLTADVTSAGGLNAYESAFGMGVRGGSSVMIDAGESLTFDFSPAEVSLLSSLIVEPLWTDGAAYINVYGDGIYLDTLTVMATTSSFVSVDVSAFGWRATSFTFEGADRTDSFAIKRLEVAVPEPAPLVLMSVGLLSLIAMRKAKQS